MDLSRFCFGTTGGNILTSGAADHVGAVLEGYFEVPATGEYKFYMYNDDGCIIHIDGVEVLNNNRLGSPQEYLKNIKLKGGIHSFRIEYFEREGNARLEIAWSGAGFAKTPFDQSNLFYLNEEPAEFLEYLAWQRDPDGDSLADAYEMFIGTDWKNADTDGDGINDGDEVNKYHTDPNDGRNALRVRRARTAGDRGNRYERQR